MKNLHVTSSQQLSGQNNNSYKNIKLSSHPAEKPGFKTACFVATRRQLCNELLQLANLSGYGAVSDLRQTKNTLKRVMQKAYYQPGNSLYRRHGLYATLQELRAIRRNNRPPVDFCLMARYPAGIFDIIV
jgi:hypothetical protein